MQIKERGKVEKSAGKVDRKERSREKKPRWIDVWVKGRWNQANLGN